jgi:hypothetical protein
MYHSAVGIISPVEFGKGLLTYSVKLWENYDQTIFPVITYIFMCWQIYTSFVVYFSNRPSGIELKLNRNVTQAFRGNIQLAFYHIQTVVA